MKKSDLIKRMTAKQMSLSEKDVEVSCGADDEKTLPDTHVDYDQKPREYTLCAISTVLNVHTRVSDLYSNPYDQIREQLRLTIENVKERVFERLRHDRPGELLPAHDERKPSFALAGQEVRPISEQEHIGKKIECLRTQLW